MYPCPCCGYLVHAEPPGSYEICPICFWEDDISQLRFPEMGGGANKISLIEAQKNFAEMGASERRVASRVRQPLATEQREDRWRPLDPKRDHYEVPKPEIDYGNSYPSDPTKLYYWRSK